MERQKVRVTKHHSVAEDLLDSAQVGSGIFSKKRNGIIQETGQEQMSFRLQNTPAVQTLKAVKDNYSLVRCNTK